MDIGDYRFKASFSSKVQLSGIYSYAIHLWQIWVAPPFPAKEIVTTQNFYMLRLGDPLVQPSFATLVRSWGPGEHPRDIGSHTPPTLSRQRGPPKNAKLLLTFDPHNGIFKQVLGRVSKVGWGWKKPGTGFVVFWQEIWWFKVWEFKSKDNGAQVLLDGLEMTSSLHFRFRKKWSILQGHCKHGHEHAEMDMFYLVSRLEIPFGRFAGPKNNCFENVSKSHIRSLFLKSTVNQPCKEHRPFLDISYFPKFPHGFSMGF